VNGSPLPASCPITVPLGLTAATPDPGASPPPDHEAFRAAVTADGALGVESLQDAHVVTALVSGTVTIRSDVIDAALGRYGYGWPLVIAPIIDGEAPDFVVPDRVVQDARGSGTEIIEHSVTEGRQYVVLYLTTPWDVPLEYRLTLPSALRVEGRVYRLEDPLAVPSSGTGMITLENPRADWLTKYLSPLMD
jgi:hypothetical protein